jgi:FkbM family methyltransferase
MKNLLQKALTTASQLLFSLKMYKYNHYRISQARAKAARSGPVFGQHFEDRVVAIVLENVQSFVDIGANDGITLSNSFFFAQQGAVGLCFEPNSTAFRLLQRVHKRNPGIILINEAIAKCEQTFILHECGYAGLLSTLTPSAKCEGNSLTREVQAKPLSHWITIYPQYAAVDLLTIDVEGAERLVLEGIDFSRFSAKIIVIEVDNPDKNEVDLVLSLLQEYGYRVFAKNPFNCFLSSSSVSLNKKMLFEIKSLSDSFEVFDSH